MAQKHLIHGLIDKSHERVTHVRAGQSLLQTLEYENSASGASPTVDHLPKLYHRRHLHPSYNDPAVALVHCARQNANTNDGDKNPNDANAMRKRLRKRAILAASQDDNPVLDASSSSVTTSFEKYHQYMDSKTRQVETLHLQNRRRGMILRTKEINQAVLAAQTQHDDIHTKLARALAVLKGGNAFRKKLSVTEPSTAGFLDVKNTHLAFLEFRKEAEEPPKQRVHPSVGLDDVNTTKKIPIHYGDQICLISMRSNLPLTISKDGRSCVPTGMSTGPHMMFTITDFRDPSRQDEVKMDDEIWLQANSTLLDVRQNATSLEDDGDDNDVESLLFDKNYFLGCPGWLDADDQSSTKVNMDASHHLQSPAKKYLQEESPSRSTKKDAKVNRFKLVAMKTMTPCKECYGDDEATREYAMETNESVMRLARWRLRHHVKHSSHHRELLPQISPVDEMLGSTLVNCARVCLMLNHFVLEQDTHLNRAVLRDYSNERSAATSSTLSHFSSNAVWQVRLLHRAPRMRLPLLTKTPLSSPEKKEVDESLEWLRKSRATMARNEKKIQQKQALVQQAKNAYDQVLRQSNSKLTEIEQHKAKHQLTYFKERLRSIEKE